METQKTSVRYENKKWKAVNYRNSFMSTDHNKALFWALKQDHPALWSRVNGVLADHTNTGIALSAPKQIIDRAFKAAALVAKGHVIVEEYTLGSERVKVLNSTGKDFYTVCRTGGVPNDWQCTCKDFRTHKCTSEVYGKTCKHIQAAQLFLAEHPQPENPTPATFDPESDPNHYKAVKDGEVFEYFYKNALAMFPQELLLRAQNILNSNGNTPDEILSCSAYLFRQIFEIPELNEGEFDLMWRELEEKAANGYLQGMKSQLIDAITNI